MTVKEASKLLKLKKEHSATKENYNAGKFEPNYALLEFVADELLPKNHMSTLKGTIGWKLIKFTCRKIFTVCKLRIRSISRINIRKDADLILVFSVHCYNVGKGVACVYLSPGAA